MTSYRTFRNSDPPHLAALWREEAQVQPLMQPLSKSYFDELVVGKPYFDPQGLVVALADDGRPIGFVHAGFGPNEARDALACGDGVLSFLLVQPEFRRQGIGRELLRRGEQYLRARGATRLQAGGLAPRAPFYWGMFGGSEPPGVPDSCQAMQALCASEGYQSAAGCRVLACDVDELKSCMDRKQLHLRRTVELTPEPEPPLANWWQASVWGDFQLLELSLTPKVGGAPWAHSLWWSLDPLSCRPGGRAAGLLELKVAPDRRRQGVATFLLIEAARRLRTEGHTRLEVLGLDSYPAGLGLFQKLGFAEVERGRTFVKQG